MVTDKRAARFLTALYAAIDSDADRRSLATELATGFGAVSAEIGFWSRLTGGLEIWASSGDVPSRLPQIARTMCNPQVVPLTITRTGEREPLLWAGIAPGPGDEPSIIAIRRDVGERQFGRMQAARLQRLLPHLRRALTLQRRLEHSNWERRLHQDALESMGLAVMVVARGGVLHWSNEVAHALLLDQRFLRLRHDKIRFAATADDAAFSRALDAACADQGVVADWLRFVGPCGVHLLVQVRPLRAATASTPPVAVVHARRTLSEPLPAKLARL